MKNALVLIDKYLPNPSSNGSCINNILISLEQKGYSAKVLSIYGSEGDGIFTLNRKKVKSNFYYKLCEFCQDADLVNELYEQSMKLNAIFQFDCIIAAFRPVEPIIVAGMLHKKLGIDSYVFLFDVVDNHNIGHLKNHIFRSNFLRLINKLIGEKNQVIALKYYKKYFSQQPNISYIGIPNLRVLDSFAETNDQIRIVYTGSFYDKIRNPKLALKALSFIAGTNIYLNLYSFGCENVVDEYADIYGHNLIRHGRVSLQESFDAIRHADILINISNDDDQAVPGKIIEYFSSGKPIINFYFREEDPAMDDYKKYPLIKNVKLSERIDVHELQSFIYESKGKVADKTAIKTLFEECDSEFIVKSFFS